MKLLVVGDVHFSTYSSILRKRGTYYSERLENCIRSIIWAEELAKKENVDKVIYLGDFFDKADLSNEELTALGEINWPNIPHTILVGNHEMGAADLHYSSAHLMNLLPGFEVVDKPSIEVGFGCRLIYLPYILENDRKTLAEYMGKLTTINYETQEVKRNIVFSHNDIKGIQYGMIKSKEGFSVEDIKYNCDLYINGHLHNCGWVVKDEILNLGNLTGQNFSEDAIIHAHKVMLLNTDTLDITFEENPYAYNFYKETVTDYVAATKLLEHIKQNAVICLKCKEDLEVQLKELLDKNTKIDTYRILTIPDQPIAAKDTIKELTEVDHIKQFKDYVIDQLGESECLLKELQELN